MLKNQTDLTPWNQKLDETNQKQTASFQHRFTLHKSTFSNIKLCASLNEQVENKTLCHKSRRSLLPYLPEEKGHFREKGRNLFGCENKEEEIKSMKKIRSTIRGHEGKQGRDEIFLHRQELASTKRCFRRNFAGLKASFILPKIEFLSPFKL